MQILNTVTADRWDAFVNSLLKKGEWKWKKKKWGKKQVRSRALLRGWEEWEFVSVVCTSWLTFCFDLCKLPTPFEESLRAPLVGIVNQNRSADLPPRVPCPPQTVGVCQVSSGERWHTPAQEAGKQSSWTLFLVWRISPLNFWIIVVLQVTQWSGTSTVVKRALSGCSVFPFTPEGWDLVSAR